MFNNETIEVSVTYGTKLTFFLQMIGISLENEWRQKLFGISEDERDEKEYEANVSLLSELSQKLPQGMFPAKPEKHSASDQTVYIEDFNNAQSAIEQFFAEKNVLKERIAYYAVRSYFTRLQPEESFL